MEPGNRIPGKERDRELGNERKLGAREREKKSEREQDILFLFLLFLFLSLLFLFLSLIFLFLGLIHYSFWISFCFSFAKSGTAVMEVTVKMMNRVLMSCGDS